jgi:hypothetical protein
LSHLYHHCFTIDVADTIIILSISHLAIAGLKVLDQLEPTVDMGLADARANTAHQMQVGPDSAGNLGGSTIHPGTYY